MNERTRLKVSSRRVSRGTINTDLARFHCRRLAIEYKDRLDSFLHQTDGAREQTLQVTRDFPCLVCELLRSLTDGNLHEAQDHKNIDVSVDATSAP